ncbi:Fanconi anemia core complex-associated protein 24 [Elgaria multicarinata webbii]|uniref:Fanconi anemia core complex-associated protein 24 n=1 Tax=Elgaria multicarinata webbii TaxID=159646 RepID=UPI002FCCD8F0
MLVELGARQRGQVWIVIGQRLMLVELGARQRGQVWIVIGQRLMLVELGARQRGQVWIVIGQRLMLVELGARQRGQVWIVIGQRLMLVELGAREFVSERVEASRSREGVGCEERGGGSGKVKLILEDGLGVVDFHLSNRSCVLYISEADLVAGNGFRRRLVRFRNACTLQGIVIVEKTQISDQYFPAVQKFVVLELGMTLLPVANQGEAAQLIIQLVHEQMKDQASNPFLNKKCPKLLEVSVFQTVQQIPGVGKTKALLLLERFGNLHQLCNASVQELEQVVGRSLAQQIHTFFTQTK